MNARTRRLLGVLTRGAGGPLLIAAACALVTPGFWLLLPEALHSNESADYFCFHEPVARNILAGDGPTLSGGRPATRYPPGFPFLLAGVFGLARIPGLSESTALAGFILLCTVLSASLVYSLARLFRGPVDALVPALAWVSYPLALWLTKQPNTESPFCAVFFGALLLFWSTLRHRPRSSLRYFLAGSLLGIAMLIRPIALGSSLILALTLWLAKSPLERRLRLGCAGALVIGSLLTPGPWVLWASVGTGRPVVLSTGAIPSIRDGLTHGVRMRGFRQGFPIPEDVRALMLAIDERYEELQSLGDVARILGEQVQKRPLAVVKLGLLKAARSWYGTDSHRFESLVLPIQAIYLLLIVASSVIAWKQGGTARQLLIGVALMAAYFWAMTIVSATLVRYMVPVMGYLFVLLPAGWGRCGWSRAHTPGDEGAQGSLQVS